MKNIIHNLLIALLLTAPPLGLTNKKTNLPNAFAMPTPPAEVTPPQTPPAQTPPPEISTPQTPSTQAPASYTPTYNAPISAPRYVHPAPPIPRTPSTPTVHPAPEIAPATILPPVPEIRYIDLTSPENAPLRLPEKAERNYVKNGAWKRDLFQPPNFEFALAQQANGRSYAAWNTEPKEPENHLRKLFSSHQGAPTLAITKDYPRDKKTANVSRRASGITAYRNASSEKSDSAFSYNHMGIMELNSMNLNTVSDPHLRIPGLGLPSPRQIAVTTTGEMLKQGGLTAAEWLTPYGAYVDYNESETGSGKAVAVAGVIPALKPGRLFNKVDNFSDAAGSAKKTADSTKKSTQQEVKASQKSGSNLAESDLSWLDRLPQTEHGVPIPSSDLPHSQLGIRPSRSHPGGKYLQSREWRYDSNGELTPHRVLDFTDHGRPSNHTNPHQHKLTRVSKDSYSRGSAEPFEKFTEDGLWNPGTFGSTSPKNNQTSIKKLTSEKSPSKKPTGDKPSGDKPSGGKPSGDKPSGGKPSGGKSSGGKSSGGKSSGGKPSKK